MPRALRLVGLAVAICALAGLGGVAPAWAADDQFGVSLPLTASDGVPGSGAGNLENSSARDIYEFTTSATRDVPVWSVLLAATR
jgi:hypothetical protein